MATPATLNQSLNLLLQEILEPEDVGCISKITNDTPPQSAVCSNYRFFVVQIFRALHRAQNLLPLLDWFPTPTNHKLNNQHHTDQHIVEMQALAHRVKYKRH